ncbi:MAG: site-specific DNA-methyltransferase, partial [Paludibacteraceae bacterium]|nr:site-specific DNA-methyltransferase [Paludibacteraceae bacterium]
MNKFSERLRFSVDGTYLMVGLRQIPRSSIREVHASFMLCGICLITCIIEKLLTLKSIPMKATKQSLIAEIEKRVSDKILEQSNADLLIKLINNADTLDEAINIAALGTTYKRTGLHFDKRLEKMNDTIKYFKKNEALSFHTDDSKPTHKVIIGDNYEALQNLLIQYRGKIDVIYIDPPYGKDSMGEFAATNYNNAITRDNLLSMLYPRLTLAKQLLSDEGVIFCSIDDKNQAYVKCLFDEVFGEGNFVANLPTIMNLKGNQDEYGFAGTHEYTIVYRKSEQTQFGLFEIEESDDEFEKWEEDEIGFYKKGANLKSTGVNAPREKRPNLFFPIYVTENGEFSVDNELSNATKVYPITDNKEMSWRWSKSKFRNEAHNIIVSKEDGKISLYKKQRPELGELPSKKPKTLFYKPEYSSGNGTSQHKSIFGDKIFGNPKPIDLIKDLIYLASNEDSIILDFFAGSGTTGHAVLEQNRTEAKEGDLLSEAQAEGNRTFILCLLNEKTDTTPNGIAYDVTSKRLKRIMTGECYDGTN